jgi:hypothetical protein
MLRRAVLALCLCAFAFCLGCGESDNKASNPNNLEFGKATPPKREGPPSNTKK